MSVDDVRRIFDDPGFVMGLFVGALAMAVGALFIAALPRSSEDSVVPLAGLLLVGAAALALRDQFGLAGDLAVGLALLALAGISAGLAGRTRLNSVAVHTVAALPGAWLISGAADLDGDVSRVLFGAAIAVGSALTAAADHSYRRSALGPVLVLASLAGVYATVPDTERALVALGAALPLAVLGWPIALASLGRAGASATVGLLAWVAATDGSARPGSVVGAIACLGILLVEPTAGALVRREPPDPFGDGTAVDRSPAKWRAAAPVLLAHVALVAVASRVAGLRNDALESALIAGLALVSATFLAARWPTLLPLTGDGGSSTRIP